MKDLTKLSNDELIELYNKTVWHTDKQKIAKELESRATEGSVMKNFVKHVQKVKK